AVFPAPVENHPAPAGEIDVAHPFGTHRALPVDRLMAMPEIRGDTFEFHGVAPHERMGLGRQQRFEFSRIEEHPETRGAALDADLRIGIERDHTEGNLTVRTGQRFVGAEVTEVDLPKVNLLPYPTEGAEPHASAQPPAATRAFHGCI